MTEIDLDPRLAELARDVPMGWQLVPDGRLVVGESEVKLYVGRAGEDLVVDRVSRGSHVGTQLRTRERSAVERYLVSWIGDAWREARRLPRVVVDPTVTAAEARVVEGDGWDATLHWSDSTRACVATELNVGSARRLAALLAHDVGVLIASYREPSGGPALVDPAAR